MSDFTMNVELELDESFNLRIPDDHDLAHRVQVYCRFMLFVKVLEDLKICIPRGGGTIIVVD